MPASIRTVNLLWETKLRGAYPAARYALADDGALAVAIPRPLEVRAYDLTRLALDGAAEVRTGFSVETMLRLEVTPYSDDFLGMTADDVYLFHNGGKQRFLNDRRINYVDAALSADGRVFVAGFSDIAALGFAVAYGEINGRVVWLHEIEGTISAVAIARDGTRLAVGTENGVMWLLDNARRELWKFEQPESVRVLACSENGLTVAYGTASGAVGVIDGEGTRVWETRFAGEIVSLALSGDGKLCATLIRPEETPGVTQIVCLTDGGQIGWEYEAERRLSSLSLSSDARYLVIGERNGTQSVYEVIAAEGVLSSPLQSSASDHFAPRVPGLDGTLDPQETYRQLRAALDASPADLVRFDALAAHREGWLQSQWTQITAYRESADYQAALDALDRVLELEPHEVHAVAIRDSVSRDRAHQLVDIATLRQQNNDEAGAEAALRQAIAVAPTLRDPRRALSQFFASRAESADRDADARLAQGELESGVAALERAQSLAPTPERARKLDTAQTAAEFASGMTAYNEKRYREAIFQFKKVLARDPTHAEARRYLNFAQRFDQDSSTGDLADRFRFLE